MARHATSPGYSPAWPEAPVSVACGKAGNPGGSRQSAVILRSSVDLPASVERLVPRLLGRLVPSATFLDFIREVGAPSDPSRIAEVLVSHAASWLPETSRAVVGPTSCEDMAVLAGSGLRPRDKAAVLAIGSWALQRSRIWSSADLSTDSRVPGGPAVSALALPLTCRMRTVAVLVVLDSRSAAGAPRLSRALRRVLRLALEPAALALDNARRIQHAERLAGTDDLTGLFNVRALTDRLRRELARASRTGQPLSLAVLDLDGFKRVNDSHGHPRGSRVLIELAALLRSSMRDTDFVARLGGDEFSVVLPDTAADGAVAAGDRLRARIARHVFLQREGLRVRLTASVGTATVSGADVKADVLLERADGALYQAKAGGGNRTACDGPGAQPGNERLDSTFDAVLSFERSGH